jgi:hypothetical protein
VALGRWRRSVCTPSIEGWVFNCGLGLRGLCYVRAKSLKSATTTLKDWRFKTRFFASFLFAFEKK